MIDKISKTLTDFIYNKIELSLTQDEYAMWFAVLCEIENMIRIMREADEKE